MGGREDARARRHFKAGFQGFPPPALDSTGFEINFDNLLAET
jgi:hypothetical protein